MRPKGPLGSRFASLRSKFAVRVRRATFLEAAGIATASPQKDFVSTRHRITMTWPGDQSSASPAHGGRAEASRSARARGLRRRRSGAEPDFGDEVNAGSAPGRRGSRAPAAATTAGLQRRVGVGGPFASYQVRVPRRVAERKGTA